MLRKAGNPGKILAITFLNILIFIHSLETLRVGHHYEINNYDDRRFLMEIVNTLPSLTEGSFIVFKDPPIHIGTINTDEFCTFVLRSFTGTHETFCFSEDTPSFSEDHSLVSLQTNLNLTSFEERIYPNYPSFSAQEDLRVFLPIDQVTWLNWDQNNLDLTILQDRNVGNRMSNIYESSYGDILFPDSKQ